MPNNLPIPLSSSPKAIIQGISSNICWFCEKLFLKLFGLLLLKLKSNALEYSALTAFKLKSQLYDKHFSLSSSQAFSYNFSFTSLLIHSSL